MILAGRGKLVSEVEVVTTIAQYLFCPARQRLRLIRVVKSGKFCRIRKKALLPSADAAQAVLPRCDNVYSQPSEVG